MKYTLYDAKGRWLYSSKTRKTWWGNGFVFQAKNGYYNKKNLKMKSVIYFYPNKTGQQQKKAFTNGYSKKQNQFRRDKFFVRSRDNTITVEWGC